LPQPARAKVFLLLFFQKKKRLLALLDSTSSNHARGATFPVNNQGTWRRSRAHSTATDKVSDLDCFDIAAPRLALDREIEHRPVAYAVLAQDSAGIPSPPAFRAWLIV
jgi:hypothetical protein